MKIIILLTFLTLTFSTQASFVRGDCQSLVRSYPDLEEEMFYNVSVEEFETYHPGFKEKAKKAGFKIFDAKICYSKCKNFHDEYPHIFSSESLHNLNQEQIKLYYPWIYQGAKEYGIGVIDLLRSYRVCFRARS